MSSSLDVEHTISSLSIPQKIRLLGGKSFFNLGSVEEANIPSLAISDGPSGVRGNQVWNALPAAVFPCGPGLAASFDLDLIQRVGDIIGQECRAKHTHVLSAPTLNVPRSPLGGRNFESFAEDPYLNGKSAAAYVKGVQGQKVAVCAKHFVANDQEFERWSIDAVVPQRALREIYLEPFRIVVKDSKPACLMTSYNSVNGCHVSENEQLLKTVLREEWGFDGCLISDWTGVYSTLKSLKAGCDIEMPGPPVMRGDQTYRLMQAGKYTLADLNERMRPILKLIKYGQESGIPFEGRGKKLDDTPELRRSLEEAAAAAVVLLKNDAKVLPLTLGPGKSIAVIGAAARIPVFSGGGSSEVAPAYKVPLLDAVKEYAVANQVDVKFAMGVHPYTITPIIDLHCRHPHNADTVDKARVEFWKSFPTSSWWDTAASLPEADWETETDSMFGFVVDGLPRRLLGNNPKIKITSTFIPDESGDWEFSLTSVGTARLYLDGRLIVDNTAAYAKGKLFVGLGSAEVREVVQGLVEGQEYALEIRLFNDQTHHAAPPPEIPGGYRVGALRIASSQALIDEAVKAAEKADATIVLVGNNGDTESEGFDRSSMHLPGASDDLVSAILAVNPNAVIVTQTGCAIAMPWLPQTTTLLHAFFGGSATGQGIWDVITGKVNPSSKLPITFPKSLEDNPSANNFGATAKTPGKVMYDEGIYIGYRHYLKTGVKPNFFFGHGLSYTTFSCSDITSSPISKDGSLAVSCTVKNIGDLQGSEVIQAYIRALDTGSPVERPSLEFVGMTKVSLGPGQSEKVDIHLEKKAFSYWSEEHNSWIAEKGDYEIALGGSLTDLQLKHTVALGQEIRWIGLE